MVKVAIVEDHQEYGLVLKEIISSITDFEVTAVYLSAETAIELINPQHCDMVVVDMRLPGISGITLIRTLKAKYTHIQYLVCSTHHDNETVFEALKAGASGYILKDSTTNQITNAVLELHRGGAPMSPYIARMIVTAMHEPTKVAIGVLSARENEILMLIAAGLRYLEIADKLFISIETVKTHIRNIYSKLHVKDKVSAINKFKNL